MAAPLGVSIAFNDATLSATPTWTRLDDQGTYPQLSLTGWSIDRGRSSELDKTGTGTATVSFIDRGGILDPMNQTTDFFGNLNPMKQAAIALQNPVDLTWTTVFTGFVSEWLYAFDPSEKFLSVTLELADAFDILSALEMMPGHHGTTPPDRFNSDQIYMAGHPSTSKHVDQRIKDVLSDAGWPSALEDIFSGNVEVQEKIYERRDQSMSALQDAADAEFPGVSNIYADKNGKFRFRGRFARFNPTKPAYGITTWKAGDFTAAQADGTYAPISGLAYRTSERDLINAAYAAPLGVDPTDVPGNLVTDAGSISTYGWRGVSFPDLLTFAGHDDLGNTINAVNETKKFATYYVNNYKAPHPRVTSLSFQMRPNDGTVAASKIAAFMCGVEIGDRIQLKTHHPGIGVSGFQDEMFFVDGIHYNADTSGGSKFTNATLDLDVTPAAFYANNNFGTVDTGAP